MNLSIEDKAFLNREGYLVLPDFLAPEELETLQAETIGIHELLGRQPPEGVLVSWEPQREPGKPKRAQQVLNAHLASPTLNAVIQCQRLISIMTGLIGPDLALFESKFLLKSSHVGSEIPWHQDFAYWSSVAAAPFQVNCMIYIDDADESNGCLQVVPRSHVLGLRSHQTTKTESVFRVSVAGEQTLRSDERPMSIPGRAGTAILFGPLLLHRSGPNRTARQRRSATIVYTSAGMGNREVETLATTRDRPDLQAFFRLNLIKAFSGGGPHQGQCGAGYRRRELWKLAASQAPTSHGAWIDASAAPSDDGSLEWLSAHKPISAVLLRSQRHSHSLTNSNREDVVSRAGLLEDLLHEDSIAKILSRKIGLAHIDAETYVDAKDALNTFTPYLDSGTVIVFSYFHGVPGWQLRTARAFHEWLEASRFGIALLGKSDFGLAVRLRSPTSEKVAIEMVEWSPKTQGITFEQSSDDGHAADPHESARSLQWTGLRMALTRVRRIAAMLMRNRSVSSGGRGEFFPIAAIPSVVGDGPRQTLCSTHCRRRELWLQAVRLVSNPALAWCEFGVGEGESLDWFSLHKTTQNTLFGFDSFQGLPEPWMSHPTGDWRSDVYVSNREDVRVVSGLYEESLARPEVLGAMGSQVGLVHIDCDLYTSTRTVLAAIGHLIDAGTVLVFDEFYGYPGWESHEAKAFREFVNESLIEFEWVARADFQVAIRILGKGKRLHWNVRGGTIEPMTEGISVSTLT